MRTSRFGLAALALTAGIALSGCATGYGDPYGYGPQSTVSIGVGYGSGYGGYGYGGYGYGSPYGGYYGGLGYGYPYSSYGAYGYDPFGWYGDYYYPGSGVYVYDRNRTRHVWSGDQQRYWGQRRQQWQSHGGSTTTGTRENWSGWDRSSSRNRSAGATAVSAGSATTMTGERSDGHHGHGHRNDRPQ